MAQLTSVSASAASSSSASTSCPPYDVFINHRGPDVKNTFAGHLYHALKSRGLQVFLDRPELQAGHNFSCQIKAAIEAASVHIAIFSENYAESKWCLEELVLMLNSRGTILPVFYNVKPSELRWTNKRKYAEALQKHEENQRYEWQTIQEWKKALSQVANKSGFELEACSGDEVELLDRVLQSVLKMVPKPPLYVAKHKIGLQEKIKNFEKVVLSQLEEEQRLEAKVAGIVGSGGIGKSTLAREFFNDKRSNYNASSFLVDVRENGAKKTIHTLQKKLIKDLTGRDISIDRWEEGIGELEKNLKSWYVLIIIDDVDHRNQLNAFLPVKHVLHPNSLILVTSRDKKVLLIEGLEESSIYHLTGLDRPNSLELFCKHAFFQPHPLPEFVDLVDEFLKACDGLPLSLVVFAAMLCGENEKSNWEEQLNGLQKLPREIKARLRISYDSLEPEEQKIFLDIACFSIGEDKDKWIRIWGGSGWKGSVGLRNLENKCLVEVDSQNKMRMHDHLRDLGRNIAQEESMPHRLWNATVKDVYDLLEQASSATRVRGIRMAPRSTVSDTWEAGNFANVVFRISKLQLLEAEGDFVESILRKVPSPNLNLIWLCWKNCPCSDLPSWLPMHDLRVLEVEGHKLDRLWQHESQAPLQLRELNIVKSLLSEIPNSIGKLQHLEKFAIGGPKLATLPEEFCCLPSLKYLKLLDCVNLQFLPSDIGNLTNLQYINLFSCINLQTLPHSFGNLTNIREIELEYCVSLEVPPNLFGILTNLQRINLVDCKSLKTLPNFSENLTNLQGIHLHGCESLEVLPDAFWTLTSLQNIDLAGCKKLKMLPNSIENLRNLQGINLESCESLKVLPDAFGILANLQKINLSGCINLKMLPNCIENLTNLRNINLKGCKILQVLPNAFGALTNLHWIDLTDCISLKMLPNSIESLTNLRCINLAGCLSLETLPNNFGNLTNLQYIDTSRSFNLQMSSNLLGNLLQLNHLHLSYCCQLTISNETLGNITTLECLDLSGCLQLEVLPLQVLHQSSLRKLSLLNTNIKELPSAPMVCLSSLEVLLLGSPLLTVLPPWLGQLTSLKKLLLHGSRELKCLPNSVGQLAQLEELHISKCGIQYLPPDVMKMNNLKTLRVFGCPLRELPFKKVEGEGEASLLTESPLAGREVDSSIDGGMIRLKVLHLYLTEISEVSFPEGVCPNLEKLKIGWCNDLVEAGALPATLKKLDLRGCSALRKIGGLWSLAKLEELDMRGCRTLQVEEVRGHESVISLEVLRTTLRSLNILKTPFETYDTDEEVKMMKDLHRTFYYSCPWCEMDDYDYDYDDDDDDDAAVAGNAGGGGGGGG